MRLVAFSCWQEIELLCRQSAEMREKMGNTRCLCEDRPACGCDADVYQPFGEEAPEYEMEDEEEENACSICHKSLTDSENEDELVMGSHADCLEDYGSE